MPKRRNRGVSKRLSRRSEPYIDLNIPELPVTHADAVDLANHFENQIGRDRASHLVIGGHNFISIAEVSLRRAIDLIRRAYPVEKKDTKDG